MGTYGEGILLSQKTRMEIMRRIIEYVPSKTIVLPHIASPDVEVAFSLAKYAKDLGYETVSSIGPVYHRPTLRGLIKYFDTLAKADVEIIIYNNSGRLRYNITPGMFENLVSEVPSIVGIKDSSYSIDQLLEYVVKFKNKFFIAGAGDNMLYYTFTIGADAHICGISNAFPELAVELYKAVINGNNARALVLQLLVNKIRNIAKMFSAESSEVIRDVLRMRGINSGYPLYVVGGLEDEERRKLRRIIEDFIKELNEVGGLNL